MIIAGGGGKNELKVFENNIDGSATFRTLCTISNLEAPVLALHCSK